MVIYLRLSLQTLVYCHSDSNIAIRMTAKKKKERERAVRRPGTMLTAYGVLLNPLTPTPAPPPTH